MVAGGQDEPGAAPPKTQHGLSSDAMALITSDCAAARPPSTKTAVITPGVVVAGVAGTSCASPTTSGVFALLNDARLSAGPFLTPGTQTQVATLAVLYGLVC